MSTLEDGFTVLHQSPNVWARSGPLSIPPRIQRLCQARRVHYLSKSKFCQWRQLRSLANQRVGNSYLCGNNFHPELTSGANFMLENYMGYAPALHNILHHIDLYMHIYRYGVCAGIFVDQPHVFQSHLHCLLVYIIYQWQSFAFSRRYISFVYVNQFFHFIVG